MSGKTGDTIRPCSSPLAVNDRPIVVLAGSVPLFRDLAPGAQGSDVAQLQKGLRGCGRRITDSTGVLGPSTLAAWNAVARGGATSGTEGKDSSIGWRQVVLVPPALTKVLISEVSAAAGGVVAATAPLMKLTAGDPIAVGGVDVRSAATLKQGQQLSVVLSSGAKTQGVVRSITAASHVSSGGSPSDPSTELAGDGRQDPAAVVSGQSRVEIAFTKPPPDDPPVSATVVVATSPASSLSVPLAAVSSCEESACVRVIEGDQRCSVPVATGLSSARTVVVKPSGSEPLEVGDVVLVERP